MIQFASGEPGAQALISQYQPGSAEYEFLDKLAKSTHVYRYESLEELAFETDLRRNIIKASYALYRGRLKFRTFHESVCNEAYWYRRNDGGFVLKKDVKPSDAVNDIFLNTRLYGTECSTAIVMIYYKAVLDSYGENLYNAAFQEIILMNWRQIDELMGAALYRRLPDYVPVDCRYFRNPDVNPLTPEWQGENTIELGNGLHYGHGIGIGNPGMFIEALNRNRIEGSPVSAYLMDNATRPDFKGLYQYRKNAILTV
ncbi:MAG: protein-glutamine gamma-glutamyltransferase [Peptococcales bacterium]